MAKIAVEKATLNILLNALRGSLPGKILSSISEGERSTKRSHL